MSPGAVVRSFFERMQAREWDGAGSLLAEDVLIDFTETGERFEGAGFLAMNRAYPEGWTIDVVEVLAVDDRVAVQVKVTQPPTVFWCAGFYRVADGQICSGVEHWVTAGSAEPPRWRAPFRADPGTDGR
ncbi:MAG: nuclear transport factor 2 family protein [Actinomycetota bacterium]